MGRLSTPIAVLILAAGLGCSYSSTGGDGGTGSGTTSGGSSGGTGTTSGGSSGGTTGGCATALCGGNCCASTESCVGGTCCTTAQTCGTTCCTGGDTCVAGACCPGASACGSACCTGTQTCLSGACCDSTQICGGTCCATGEICLNDGTNQFCGQDCSDGGGPCPAAAPCCTLLNGCTSTANCPSACVPAPDAGAYACRCATGADCPTGCCAPINNAGGFPVGPSICAPSDGATYDCCTNAGMCTNASECCFQDPVAADNLCALPCTSDADCTPGHCHAVTGSSCGTGLCLP